jgi:hypothetical protein
MMLKAEEPAPAKKLEKFYANAFDPEQFFKDSPLGGGAE